MGTTFRPGCEVWLASDSPVTEFSGIFEDDGTTGYLYAYDRSGHGSILDAVHIYNVASTTDGNQDSDIDFRWSADGLKVGLLINERLHALIDFESRAAYSRSNSPPPGRAWGGRSRQPWDEALAHLLEPGGAS